MLQKRCPLIDTSNKSTFLCIESNRWFFIRNLKLNTNTICNTQSTYKCSKTFLKYTCK